MSNFILNTDSYKVSHFLQYPPGTQYLSSYIEARNTAQPHHQTLFFGLQAYLRGYLEGSRITMADIDEAEQVIRAHGFSQFHRAGWEHIVRQHDGRLPIEITAVPEGTVVPNRNVLLQVRNTDPAAYWLPSYVETSLLRAVWYASTVATHSWRAKQIIRQYLADTADSLDGLPFKLHDFGYRGVSSQESGMLGGMAHLVNFLGTDTLGSLVAAKKYYDADDMPGFSIPAAEHSTITTWVADGEEAAYANMIDTFGMPGSLVAVVSDSYDIYAACDLWGTKLKRKVIDSGATLVVRPDSGDPVIVTQGVIERLAQYFGTTLNTKGYRVLNHVRIIQGDGISLPTLETILANYKKHGWSADNIAFGMGAGLLQYVNRDTYGFSMKCSAACVDGVWRDVYKEPVTAVSKRSQRGVLALVQEGDAYVTMRESDRGTRANMLQPVFRDGEILRTHTFADIRARSASCLD